MHMADALVAPAVATTMYLCSAAAGGYSVRQVRALNEPKKVPVMGVMGAFVFATQMINFTIPGTGSSGHLCGGMLLSALLGPYAGFLTMIGVLLIQCLLFADGGLLALGCNIWNMAFYGCFIGALLIWKPMMRRGASKKKIVAASVLGCVLTLQLGAFSVTLETLASGITELPFQTFVAVMQPIHLAIGLVEGLITAAVLCYFIAMIFRDYFIVKQVFSIILITFFMLLYLKLSFGKAMILSALFESLLLVMDYFALLMNIYIFHNMEEVWESHVIQGSLVVVLGKALLLFAVLIIRNHMEKKSLAMLADTEWLRFIFFPIFTICVITAMIKMSEDIKNKAQENLFFVIACGLAGMNIVVFYLIYDILKRENKLQEERIYRIQVKNQIGMYRSISENFDKQKKMTHEYKNQIMCIDSLIKKKKYDSLESFVNKISGQISKELDFICTNNVIVDAVLNTKYQEIRDKGIVFVFKINDLSSLNISDEDVVVIMSNLLNNAIEACEKCRGDKIIKLKIVIEDNNAIISVKNTYENAVIYENGEIQTTKILDTDEHGIGIKNIAETIRKYGGSYVIQNDEREFYFSIMIPLVKSDF